MLQSVAVCCSVLQRRHAGDSKLARMAIYKVCCSVLQYVAVCYSVLQCVAVCCSVLQCVAVCCSVMECVVLSCRENALEILKLARIAISEVCCCVL